MRSVVGVGVHGNGSVGGALALVACVFGKESGSGSGSGCGCGNGSGSGCWY